MKQHITVEQLEGLTGKQYSSIFGTLGDAITMGDMSRAITIGKMIEMLSNDDYRPHITPIHYETKQACVTLYKKEEGKTCRNIISFKCKELTDALWQAVKEVL